MKVLQTIAGLGASSGGPSTCTYDLLCALHREGCNVELMTMESSDLLGRDAPWMKALPQDATFGGYAYSKNMREFLKASDYDIYHTNGMWMDCNNATCDAARKKGKPYIITPHGMLYPGALARSAWKKRLMLLLFFDKHLQNAACIHATCHEEWKHYRALGYKNPVAVIPNPCVIPEYISNIKAERSKRRIGYLGRLHPYKQPDVLLKAWAQLSDVNADAELVLMGTGTPEYEAYLRQLVEELKLTNVTFAGMVVGQKKFEMLVTFTALCVPSKSENFGMTVAESLIAKTPVICTNTAPWEDLNTHHCGWWVNNDVDTIASTIRKAFSLPQSELGEMGENGRQLIAEKYSDTQVAKQMRALYEWIYGGPKPDFVYCD